MKKAIQKTLYNNKIITSPQVYEVKKKIILRVIAKWKKWDM